MCIIKRKYLNYFFLLFLLLFSHVAKPYDLSGVNASFNFGTIASPFPDLTLQDASVCVGYTVVVEKSTYLVRATSSGSSSTAFQMTNGASSTVKLNYTVSWAGSSGGSPTFVTLSSGQDSSSSFPAQLLGALTCSLLPANATLKIQLLNADQMLARQGNYTDTLTILIVSS